jgi:hypothetical protein
MANQQFNIESHFADKSPVVQKIYNKLLSETCKTVLALNIKSAAPIASSRFPKFEKVSASRYRREVKLADPFAVDMVLLGWLKQAYDLSA